MPGAHGCSDRSSSISTKRQSDGANATISARCARRDWVQTGTVKRERKHPSTKTRSSPNAHTDPRARDLKRLAGKRDELIGTVYELYGRANEVALRLQDDVRTLVDLHRETTELLYVLRSLPSEQPPAPASAAPTPPAAAPTRDSGPRLPRLLPFREVSQRVALSRSTIWRMERAGQFPKRRRLSVNKVAWWEPEIEEWLRSRLDRQV
jgi:prophage regulatory protein